MGLRPYSNFAFGIPSTPSFNLREILEQKYPEIEDQDAWTSVYYNKKTGQTTPNYATNKWLWEEWIKLKHEFCKNLPCEIQLSGYDGELQYHLVIKESVKESNLSKNVVQVGNTGVFSRWIEALKDVCDTLEIPFEEPCWFLSTLYF
jgi:hypothetical protein